MLYNYQTMHDDYAWIDALFITLSCNLATYSQLFCETLVILKAVI